eukprot:15112438-Ditylum_brightwellii.AAC.1
MIYHTLGASTRGSSLNHLLSAHHEMLDADGSKGGGSTHGLRGNLKVFILSPTCELAEHTQ